MTEHNAIKDLRQRYKAASLSSSEPGLLQAIGPLLDIAEAADGILALYLTGTWQLLKARERQHQFDQLAAALARLDETARQ